MREVAVSPQLGRRKICDWNGLDWLLYDLMQCNKIG